MKQQWLQEAVTNNADWCNAVAQSHGIVANWSEGTWFCEHPMPTFYPNLITLHSGASVDEQINTIESAVPQRWGIKDSYKELTLSHRGFALAFEAHWYCRLPNQEHSWTETSNAITKFVTDQSGLDRWVAAWGESAEIFRPKLLENDEIDLVYVEQGGVITGGLATNLSGKSVGISNAFGRPADIFDCICAISKSYPNKLIVGYGSDAETTMLAKVGFQDIGELQVWLSTHAGANLGAT